MSGAKWRAGNWSVPAVVAHAEAHFESLGATSEDGMPYEHRGLLLQANLPREAAFATNAELRAETSTTSAELEQSRLALRGQIEKHARLFKVRAWPVRLAEGQLRPTDGPYCICIRDGTGGSRPCT